MRILRWMLTLYITISIPFFAYAKPSVDVSAHGIVMANSYFQYLNKDLSPTVVASWQFKQELHPFTRFNLTAKSNNVTAFIEMGVKATGPYTRHAFISWKASDNSSILIGHTWSILDFAFPAQQMFVSGIKGLGYGNLYGGRYLQIRYTTNLVSNMSLKLAVVQPTIGTDITGTAITTKAMLPKLETALNLKMGKSSLNLSGSFNSYTLVDAISGTDTTNLMLNTFAGAIFANMNLKPVYVLLNFYGGQNLFTYGLQNTYHLAYYDGTNIDNSLGYGGFVQIVYALSLSFKAALGGGIDYAQELTVNE